MNISLSALKENPVKYFEFAKTADVIVTRRGERIGRIVSEEKAAQTDRQRAIESLIGSVVFPAGYNDQNHDPDYDLLRVAAYQDRGLM